MTGWYPVGGSSGVSLYTRPPKSRVFIVAVACLVGLALHWLWIDHSFIAHSEGSNIWVP